MAQTQPLSRNWSQGFRSDEPRDQLPPGAAFRMKDYIPQLESEARKRGGWAHATNDLGVAGGALRGAGIVWAPFSGDPHLVTLDEVGRVYRSTVFDGTSGTLIGATHGQTVSHRPFWHKDRIIIPTKLVSNTSPYKYYDSGGAVYATAVVGGTPPNAAVGWSWGDYLILANGYVTGTRYPYRIWISGVGNSDSWTPGTNFWDMPKEIVTGVSMRQFQLVWGYEDTWMLTGDTPPANGNWARRDLFAGIGCMDGRTVTKYRDYAIWANNSGIFKTDGTTPVNLTDRAGVSLYWASLVAGFNYNTGWQAAADIYAGNYVITVYNAAGQLVVTLAIDLETETCTEFTNIPAAMFAARTSGPGTASAAGSEELFFAHRTLPRGERMSTLWTPSTTYALDADGTAVLPTLETPFYKIGSAALKRIRRAYITYDVRTAGGSPYLVASYTLSPEVGASYTTASPTLPTTTKLKRAAVEIRKKAYGFGLKIVQVASSADTRLGEIEVEGHSLEQSR